MDDTKKQEALHYHAKGRPGKITIVPTKETKTQKDLSLAYSPGVAEPCLEIYNNVEDVYKYTAKGNLVAVISNGSAVLGLGDIGPEASKPVMEGKGVLFKVFADIDVFDIEINEKDPKKFVEIVKSLEPTFGGINLEDIKAPECFEIEQNLKKQLHIPVMHDDQHGTAIISTAGLLNAIDIQKKDIKQIKVIVNGAGAAAISCMQLYMSVGVNIKNIYLFDSKGFVNENRKDLGDAKLPFAKGKKQDLTLDQAMKDSDVFIGLSKGNTISKHQIQSMAPNPIVFAMANPDPEISYSDATECRKDIIMATGRSDFPNQINNVLGFPYIFRGALDVRATTINEEMKIAAVYALANLAKEPVPSIVSMAYDNEPLVYGKNYIIPKPFDPRLLATVSPAVAQAAMDSGVAKHPIIHFEEYKIQLNKRLGLDNQLVRILYARAKSKPKKILFINGDNIKVIQAAYELRDQKIAYPYLMGDERIIKNIAEQNQINIEGIEIIDQRLTYITDKSKVETFADLYFHKMQRKGVSRTDADRLLRSRVSYAMMMLETNEVDGIISNDTSLMQNILKEGIRLVGTDDNTKRTAGMYILFTDKGPLFFADTNINLDPTAEDLAEICLVSIKKVRSLGVVPQVALLSYSNYGSVKTKIKYATVIDIVKKREPNVIIDGEIQGMYAFNKTVLKENYPFSEFKDKSPNVLIFPDVASANISYNLMQEFTRYESIGPIMLGFKKPVHVVQIGSTVRQLVNIATIAVIEAQK